MKKDIDSPSAGVKKNLKFFVVFCKNCKYNITGFGRNYFAAINCFCVRTNRQKSCSHYLTLQMSLNNNARKMCIEKETKIDFLKLIPINLTKKINASCKILKKCRMAMSALFISATV